ncbi:collagen binding domain-containing protein [Schaalia sp. Marseille-Q2122]|uniref:MSCRAMM family protein n=1 Tax=Schaalia sp. Marseille-Q2122 TaxID=2736604 RepID=UPI00158B6BF1|nr:prealbumin-like fold domain-containing protein [Schaalia sp. Marseille-Q2122]
MSRGSYRLSMERGSTTRVTSRLFTLFFVIFLCASLLAANALAAEVTAPSTATTSGATSSTPTPEDATPSEVTSENEQPGSADSDAAMSATDTPGNSLEKSGDIAASEEGNASALPPQSDVESKVSAESAQSGVQAATEEEKVGESEEAPMTPVHSPFRRAQGQTQGISDNADLFECRGGHVYTLSEHGQIYYFTGGRVKTIGSQIPALGNGRAANAFGIDLDGRKAYAIVQGAGSQEVHRYTLSRGWEQVGSVTNQLLNGRITSGAVHPQNDEFYFGGFDLQNRRYRLWRYSPSDGRVQGGGGFQLKGFTPAETGESDIAFDMYGNLRIMVSARSGNSTRLQIYGLKRDAINTLAQSGMRVETGTNARLTLIQDVTNASAGLTGLTMQTHTAGTEGVVVGRDATSALYRSNLSLAARNLERNAFFNQPDNQGVIFADAASCEVDFDIPGVHRYRPMSIAYSGIASQYGIDGQPFIPERKYFLKGFTARIFPRAVDNRRIDPAYMRSHTWTITECEGSACGAERTQDISPESGAATVYLPLLTDLNYRAHYCVELTSQIPTGYIFPQSGENPREYCGILPNSNASGVGKVGMETSLRPLVGGVQWSKFAQLTKGITRPLPGAEWRIRGTYDAGGEQRTIDQRVVPCQDASCVPCNNFMCPSVLYVKKDTAYYNIILPPGRYTLEETSAPPGYERRTDKIPFTVTVDTTNVNPNAITVPKEQLGTINNPAYVSRIDLRVAFTDFRGQRLPGDQTPTLQARFEVEKKDQSVWISPGGGDFPAVSSLVQMKKPGNYFPDPWFVHYSTSNASTPIRFEDVLPPNSGFTRTGVSCVGKKSAISYLSVTGTGAPTARPVPKGEEIECYVTYVKNATTGAITWQKTTSGGTLLRDSQWQLIPVGPGQGSAKEVRDCVATSASQCPANSFDKDHRAGYFDVRDLPFGRYRLVETQAPTGYDISPNYALNGPAQVREISANTPLADFGKITNEKSAIPGQTPVSIKVVIERSSTSDVNPALTQVSVRQSVTSTGAPITFAHHAAPGGESTTAETLRADGTVALSNTLNYVDNRHQATWTITPTLPADRSYTFVSARCTGKNNRQFLNSTAQTAGLTPAALTTRAIPAGENVTCELRYRPADITSQISATISVEDERGRPVSSEQHGITLGMRIEPGATHARFNTSHPAQLLKTQESTSRGTFPQNWIIYHANPTAQPQIRFSQQIPQGRQLQFLSMTCQRQGQAAAFYTSQDPQLPASSTGIAANSRIECALRYRFSSTGSASWSKVDAHDTSKTLAGSAWRIKPVGTSLMVAEGITISDCVAATESACANQHDRDRREGHFTVTNIPLGTYDLIEEQAPNGYSKAPTKRFSLTTGQQEHAIGAIPNSTILPEVTISAEVLEIRMDGRPDAHNKHAGFGIDVRATAGIDHLSPHAPNTPLIGKQGITGADWQSDTTWKARLHEGQANAGITVDSQVSPHAPHLRRAMAQCQHDLTANQFEILGYTYMDGELALTDVPAGAHIHCVFIYAPEGYEVPVDLQWRKTDAQHNPLPGSEWTLARGDQSLPIIDCTDPDQCDATHDIDPQPGVIRIERLAPGEYTLTETKAPLGYALAAPQTIRVLPRQDVTDLGDIVNTMITPPALPLTGGVGADYVLATGAGFFLLSGIGWVLSRRQERKKRAI